MNINGNFSLPNLNLNNIPGNVKPNFTPNYKMFNPFVNSNEEKQINTLEARMEMMKNQFKEEKEELQKRIMCNFPKKLVLPHLPPMPFPMMPGMHGMMPNMPGMQGLNGYNPFSKFKLIK